MVIGALRLTFLVPPDGKSTRSVAHKIKDHLWSKFKVSLAEVPTGTSSGGELVIGLALASPEEKLTRQRLDEIVRHLHEWGGAELVHDDSEVIRFDDLEMERDFEKYNP